jgi:hypothetical protein
VKNNVLKLNTMRNSVIIFVALLLCSHTTMTAQNNSKGNPDNIILTAYVPQSIEGIPEIAKSTLQNKLNRIITANGLGAAYNQRFVISANVSLLTKDITATAPPMHNYTLDVTLYIGDGFDGKMFASTSTTLKGVGETEAKAYLSALRNLKEKNPDITSFIETGKQKIIDYYTANCDLILKEAQTAANANNYEAAIASLMSIPMACADCYNKALDATYLIYKKMINRDCKKKLNEANAAWSAGQSFESASEAASILATIDPEADCFGEVKTLYSNIKTRVLEIDKREWNYVLKAQLQESERIEAWRAIGVAYGSHQQSTTIHYKTLW